nr:LysR family substrate-binding domain-containing protein [Pseudogemmobacter hezensis]
MDIGIRTAIQEGRGESGGAAVGVVTTLAGGILRSLFESFKQKHPTLALRIQSGSREEQIEALRNNAIDILFLPGQDAGEGFDAQLVGHERIHVALAKDHPLSRHPELTWDIIRGETFLLPRSGAGPEVHGYIMRRVSEFSTRPNVTFQDLPLDEVMHLVAMNEGISIITEGWTHIQAPNLEFRPLNQPSEILPLFAVWSSKRDNPVLRRFVSHLRSFSKSNITPIT